MTDLTLHQQYVTRIDEILWGISLVALTLIIHAFGMLWIIRLGHGFKERFETRPTLFKGIFKLILSSWMIVIVHIVEVMAWAAFFQWKHCFANYSTACYFGFLEYTTVGSEYNLPLRWRLLEGMIATAGLLGFAWSTGVLLTLAQELQDLQVKVLNERRMLRQARRENAAAHSGGKATVHPDGNTTVRPDGEATVRPDGEAR